jgi:hypothetical protein
MVPDSSRVEGLTLVRDGKDLGASLWGQALPVDPGTVQVTAAARGRESWAGQAELKEGKTEELVVPLLKPLPPGAEPAAAPGPAAPAAAPVAKPPDQTTVPEGSQRGKTQRIASYVVGGVAGVALVATGFLALQARSKNEDSRDSGCGANFCTTQAGIDLRNDALRYGNWATVTGVAAGVMAAGAVTLYFTAPKAQVGLLGGFDRQGGTVALKGRW